jgi:O-glycosyl hydrolase
MRTSTITTVTIAFLALTVSVGATTIAIDLSVEHQTMEGFGVYYQHGAIPDYAVSELGATIVRTDIFPDLSAWDGRIASVRETNAVYDRLGEPVRFLASCWTPPTYMKDLSRDPSPNCSDPICGGHLRPEAYDDFGAHVTNFVTAVRERAGVELYAISLQNEPAFIEPYWSCVYTAEEYRDMAKVAGPIIHATHPDLKLFGAEDMLGRWTAPGAFPGVLMADAACRAQLAALAVHGYSDGVHPTPTSGAATKWSRAARNCASAGRPLWMTETSGYATDWNGAMQLGEAIYSALKYGKVSAWVWWQLDQLTGGGAKPKTYWASRNFYRWIRPGAIMVDAASSDELVFVVAFHHKANRTLSVVLINGNSGQRDVSLAGDGLPAQFRRYLTSASENCSDRGTTGSTLSLPGNSITTLYAEGYAPSTAVDLAQTSARVRSVAPARVELFALNGQRIVTPRHSPTALAVRRAALPGGGAVASLVYAIR